MRRSIVCLGSVLSAGGVAAAGDYSFVQRVQPAGGAFPFEEMAYFREDKAARESGRSRFVVDVKEKTLTTANRDSETYSVLPLEALRRTGSGTATLEPTGKKEKIAGHKAREYTIAGDRVSGTIWLGYGFDIPAGTREWALRAGAVGPKVPAPELTEAIVKQQKGMPLRSSVTMASGATGLTTATEVLVVHDAAVADDLLAPPKGFKKAAAK